MILTDEVKRQIDCLDYVGLLSRWRFAPAGDAIFQGESGEYFSKRMAELRSKDPEGAVAASKMIGWK